MVSMKKVNIDLAGLFSRSIYCLVNPHLAVLSNDFAGENGFLFFSFF